MPDVKISEGSVILKGCIISNRCKIGKHCHLNTGTILDHDNIFNDFASTGPGVITGGNVQVGLESFVRSDTSHCTIQKQLSPKCCNL